MSHVVRLDLGGVVVDVLRDALADHPSPLPDAFPGAPAAGWDAVRQAFPATVGAGGRWRLPVHVALVRTRDALMLIDAGVGPAGTAAAGWLQVDGDLEADLAALGAAPSEVDVVVLTHLHQDHVGWLSRPGTGRPTFANARHVVSRRERAAGAGEGTPPYVAAALDPVEAAGLLDVDGALPSEVRMVPLPGHTPGHSGVLVEGAERRLLYAGDAFNHPLQLTEPDVPSLADGDAPRAAETRRSVLARARNGRVTVMGAHLPGASWFVPDAAGPPQLGDAMGT